MVLAAVIYIIPENFDLSIKSAVDFVISEDTTHAVPHLDNQLHSLGRALFLYISWILNSDEKSVLIGGSHKVLAKSIRN